ncbi:hypothetical protein F4779DRAFT_616338 [Xylariaceae sp. FL0662B]|nr:hypothetical protein F4779DRAFT_616338 [Xylariaceae sp. FL0662B]
MARPAISAQGHILRALSHWPKDTIRPEIQFQNVLRKRFEQSPDLPEVEQLRQANALYSLVNNRYKRKYPITGSLLRPKSNPTYFDDLLRELREAPNRSITGYCPLASRRSFVEGFSNPRYLPAMQIYAHA